MNLTTHSTTSRTTSSTTQPATSRTTARGWGRGTVAVVAVAVVAVGASAACGVRTEGDARFVDDDEVPFGLLDVETTQPPGTVSPSTGGSSVELCFVDGEVLVPSARPAPADLDLSDVVELLGGGPNRLEVAAGLGSALADGAVAGPVDSTGGIAEVDLAESFADTGGPQQVLAIAQLVCTLTARPGIGQVTFTLDGRPIAVPRGDASTTTDPVTRDDYQRLITDPTEPVRR